MSRQLFTSRNNIGQVLTFQKSGATSSFDPSVNFSAAPSRRASWRLDNGTNITQIAGNAITYTGFTSDSNIRSFQIRFDNFIRVGSIILDNDNLYGNLNLSNLKRFNSVISVSFNPNLTGITFPSTNTLGNNFQVQATDCNLTGNLDLSPIVGLAGSFFFQNNPNLTGITHSQSSRIITQYIASNCNLIGNIDLTLLTGLSGVVYLDRNDNLTGITHSTSSRIFTNYQANQCNLTGNLNLTPLSGLGGSFRIFSNSGLTSITHSVSTQNFTEYFAFGCNLTGTLDLSPLTKLGGPNSGISSAYLTTYSNLNLTNIIFPNSNQFFKNGINTENNGAFSLHSCNLDYIDFRPLSGATLLTGSTGNPRISLRNNGMSTADVNHILVDFSGNATYNPTGWSNVNLNISGTNGAPNSGTGGYDGIAARNFLTGSPYNWTITHSV